jgi:hypothetical protein
VSSHHPSGKRLIYSLWQRKYQFGRDRTARLVRFGLTATRYDVCVRLPSHADLKGPSDAEKLLSALLSLFHRIAPDHSGCSMNWTHTSCTLLLVVLGALEMSAQTSPLSHPDSNSATNVPAERTIALSVPTGTPLQIALDREVRVKKAGQTVHARFMQPVSLWTCSVNILVLATYTGQSHFHFIDLHFHRKWLRTTGVR